MSGLNFLKQLLLPGVKTAKGTAPIPGKPGYYTVDPSTANVETRDILKRASRRAIDEGDLAEALSKRGRQDARGAYMLGGALNELRYASEVGGGLGRPVKGVVYVDKAGNPRAGAAINKEKGGEYLEAELLPPNYLEYIATTIPDVRGSDLMRQVQDLYGPDMVFQVANPKKNVPIYESWGARRMAPRIDGGDVLGGDDGLPAFRIEKYVEPRAKGDGVSTQLRLPGFKGGGLAALLRNYHG